jgi:hypothetical protein
MTDAQIRESTAQPDPTPGRASSPTWQRILLGIRVLLAAALLVMAAAQMTTFTTEESGGALGDDLAEGRVSWIGFGYIRDDSFAMGVDVELTAPEFASAVVWRTGRIGLSSARLNEELAPIPGVEWPAFDATYDSDDLDDPGSELAGSAHDRNAAMAAAIAAHAREQGIEVATSGKAPLTWRLAHWYWVLFVALTFSVALGPQPRRATRWAWVWRLWLPFGAGVLWLLAREAPWSRRASALPAPLPAYLQRRRPEGDARFPGGMAFVALLGAWLVVDMLLSRLR